MENKISKEEKKQKDIDEFIKAKDEFLKPYNDLMYKILNFLNNILSKFKGD